MLQLREDVQASTAKEGWLLTVADARFAESTEEAAEVSSLAQGDTPEVTRSAFGPFPPLPGTALESRAIAAAFAETNVVSLHGDDAHEAAVKEAMARARWIHLATHGVVDETQSEMLAGLVFSPSPETGASEDADDGTLNLFELYELSLRCELAVLSACDTRSGPNLEGEGVFALSRGFLTAGAERTVASLWAVADASTAELMSSFFEGIAAAVTRGEAADYSRLLRDAKRGIRQQAQWQDPWFWAPFVLSGLDGGDSAAAAAEGRR